MLPSKPRPFQSPPGRAFLACELELQAGAAGNMEGLLPSARVPKTTKAKKPEGGSQVTFSAEVSGGCRFFPSQEGRLAPSRAALWTSTAASARASSLPPEGITDGQETRGQKMAARSDVPLPRATPATTRSDGWHGNTSVKASDGAVRGILPLVRGPRWLM